MKYLYQYGIEKMKFITMINVISRLIFAGFIFVNNPEDFWKVPMFNLIGGAISMYVIFFKPTIKDIQSNISGSFPFFIALISRDSYIRATPVIVGTFIGLKEVDLADKILSALKSFVSIVYILK